MARHEQDREDLLAEATALRERIELRAPAFAEPITVGFREGGAASVYFGGAPVYQFDSHSRLRRGFVDGALLKAEQGRLVILRRERTAAATLLVRQELDDAAQREILERAQADLQRLAAELQSGRVLVLGQVPEGADVLARLRAWLTRLPADLEPALSPRVR